MKKLYAKNEVAFAVIWIIAYCCLSIPIRGQFGDESPWMLIALSVIALGITAFIGACGLAGKYGLDHWPKGSRRYLWFIPMWILVTGNLWGGISVSYSCVKQITAVISMLLIGYIEEVIFRGFLFRAMIPKDGIRISVIVSAVTFGIGHIINLFAGQASLETVVQVFFAIAWGFIFTLVYYKSGSLIPCILAHSLVDAFSKFGSDSEILGWIYMTATIIIGAVYCVYLAKLPAKSKSEF